jgi:hypothetical protein
MTKVKKKVKIPSTVEMHGIADKLGADDNTVRFRALVPLAGVGCDTAKWPSRDAKTSTRTAQW